MAKAKTGDVIFHRGSGNDHEDIWDDSVLIDAYEKAVGLAYDAVHATMQSQGEFSAEELDKHGGGTSNRSRGGAKEEQAENGSSLSGADASGKKKNKKRKSQRKKWQVGDRCLSKFSEDGQWYEAEIIAMDRSNNQCTVRYSEYENEENVNLGTLQKIPETSVDEDSSPSDRDEPLDMSVDEIAQTELVRQLPHTSSTVPLFPPPVPPHLLRHPGGIPQEDEAMASMLMSWYTSGYHTGYYQAMRDTKRAKK